jgi:hypothetical protein
MARLLLAVLVVLGSVFWGGTPALAAAPWLVLVYGPPLDRPVLLDNWSDTFALLGAEAPDIQLAELADRPFLSLALFWGPKWDDYVRSGQPLDQVRPEQATSLGGFILLSAAMMRCLCWIPLLGQARQCGACRRGAWTFWRSMASRWTRCFPSQPRSSHQHSLIRDSAEVF